MAKGADSPPAEDPPGDGLRGVLSGLSASFDGLEPHERLVRIHCVGREKHTWTDEGMGTLTLLVGGEGPLDDDGVEGRWGGCEAARAKREVCLATSVRLVVLATTPEGKDSPTPSQGVLMDAAVADNREYAKLRDLTVTWKCGGLNVFRGLTFTSPIAHDIIWCIVMAISSSLASDDDSITSDSGDESETGLSLPTRENLPEFAAQLGTIESKMSTLGEADLATLLAGFTTHSWLGTLWKLSADAERLHEHELLASVAELLMRFVVIYMSRFNPFSLKGEEIPPALCRGRDPLVVLLNDDNYLPFFRALEYEREMVKHTHVLNHREFLSRAARFHDILPINDRFFRTAVQLIYRLSYIRDVCMPRHLEEGSLHRFSFVINAGYVFVLKQIFEHPTALAALKERSWTSVLAVHCLNGLLGIMRVNNNMPSTLLSEFFAIMKNIEILEPLEAHIRGTCTCDDLDDVSDALLRETSSGTIAIEILHHVAEVNPTLLRHALFASAAKDPGEAPRFWMALADVLCSSTEEGAVIQISEIFRYLLANASLEEVQRDAFLSLFYDRGIIDRLIEAVKSTSTPRVGHEQIAEILAFCVRQHQYRMKYKVLQTNLPLEMMRRATAPATTDKFLAIYAVKFLKACVASQAEFYSRHFTTTGVLDEVVSLLLRQQKVRRSWLRCPLLESVVLELFGLICFGQQASLIHYLFERLGEQMEELRGFYKSTRRSVNVFEKLREKYEDSQGPPMTGGRTEKRTLLPAQLAARREVEAEERYLLSEDEDVILMEVKSTEPLPSSRTEQRQPPPRIPAGLVNYEDEETGFFRIPPAVQKNKKLEIRLAHLSEDLDD